MTPWRTSIVSKSWMIFATYVPTGWKPTCVSWRALSGKAGLVHSIVLSSTKRPEVLTHWSSNRQLMTP